VSVCRDRLLSKISHKILEKIFATAVGFLGPRAKLGSIVILQAFVAVPWRFLFVIFATVAYRKPIGESKQPCLGSSTTQGGSTI
jgi:hypothetical protein